MKVETTVLVFLFLGGVLARIEVSPPQPLDGPPVNFLPETYAAHFVKEGKGVT